MVRGNWQKRVESAHARRAQEKQRKQDRKNKGMYKSMVYEFLNMANDAFERGVGKEQGDPTLMIHVWTDTVPPSIDSLEAGHSLRDKKEKWSHPKKKNKKKSHPRSGKREAEDSQQGELAPTTETSQMCPAYFFTGSCEFCHHKTTAPCRDLIHAMEGNETIYGLAKRSAKKRHETVKQGGKASEGSIQQALQLSLNALSSTGNDENMENASITGSMDAVYHLAIPINMRQQGSVEDIKFISEQISSVLSQNSSSVGSIVYAVVNDTLLFDRYRGGVIVSQSELEEVLFPGRGPRLKQVASLASANKMKSMPPAILEQVVMFLPASAFAAMKRVCKSWNDDIGTKSPSIWKYWLQEREWSYSDIAAENVDDYIPFRNRFVEHYSIMRNINALHCGWQALSGQRGQSTDRNEMAIKRFTIGSDGPTDHCIATRIWSPNRALFAYRSDSTLRLFDAVSKQNQETGDESSHCRIGCRQVMCIRLGPPGKEYNLKHLDIDEQMVFWTFASSSSLGFLVTTNREDLICCAGDEVLAYNDDIVSTFSIQELVNEHIEEDDSDRYQTSVTACGNGLVLLALESEPIDRERYETQLFLISSHTGLVVWTRRFSNFNGHGSFQTCRRLSQDSPCMLSVLSRISNTSFEMRVLEIQSTGVVTNVKSFTDHIPENSIVVGSPMLALSATDVVRAANIFTGNQVDLVISLCSVVDGGDESSLQRAVIRLPEMGILSKATSFGDDYVVLSFPNMVAIVIHVPTRSVLANTMLGDLYISVSGDTLAGSVYDRGIVLTGGDVRDVADISSNTSDFSDKHHLPKKKKKKRQSGKGGKKDGFARGMSLRG